MTSFSLPRLTSLLGLLEVLIFDLEQHTNPLSSSPPTELPNRYPAELLSSIGTTFPERNIYPQRDSCSSLVIFAITGCRHHSIAVAVMISKADRIVSNRRQQDSVHYV